MSKGKELTNQPTEQQLAELRSSFPTEPAFNRILLPRLGMVSQDKTEGRGKTLKVISEAGTFFTERETEELDENGKKIWAKTELGTEINGIIFFARKQLRYYDEATEKYTSSPIYDLDSEVVPLFCDKKEVARGTPADLKKNYEYTDKDGKVKSRLEENRILYVLYEDEVYQMNLRGSSMYSFMKYARSVLPPSVITTFGSETREKGSIVWNAMTFEVARPLTTDEADLIVAKQKEIRDAIVSEKQFFNAKAEETAKADEDMEKLTSKF